MIYVKAQFYPQPFYPQYGPYYGGGFGVVPYNNFYGGGRYYGGRYGSYCGQFVKQKFSEWRPIINYIGWLWEKLCQ